MSYRDEEGNRKNGSGCHDQFAGGNGARGQGANAKGEKCVKKRLLNGRDKWGGTDGASSGEGRDADGKRKTRDSKKKSMRRCTSGKSGGDTIQDDCYLPPVLANPGNLIKGIKVGGGLMGHKLAHENEAPYPQKLAEWFIISHCEKGGVVLDPFSGSGTTVAAAATLGRQAIGFDLRLSQCDLGRRRVAEVQPVLY